MTQLTVSQPQNLHRDPFQWAEIQRILGLQIVHPMSDAEAEAFNQITVQAAALQQGFKLSKTQCDAICTYQIHQCLFGLLPVGEGKTLVSLACASAAYTRGLTKIVLFVPPEVMGQLTDTDIAWARTKININYPVHVLGGKSPDYRRNLCKSGMKGLYIMPYSLLSTKDTSDNLEALAPNLIIADEGHRLANHSAARTRRFLAMFKHLVEKGRKPDVVILSGTITSKSIKDYYHLIKICMGDKCPLPLSDSMANDWAILVDAQAASPDAPTTAFGAGPIIPVVEWAKEKFPQTAGGFPSDVMGFRKAFQLRLNTAPGVVHSTSGGIGTSLIIHNEPVADYAKHPDYGRLKELCDKITDDWVTPNGDEIDFAIHKWKWLNELTCGFYNELTWPTKEVYAKRKAISEAEADSILTRAKIHHQAGQEYAKILRKWLMEKSRAGIDTPFLCGQDMVRNGAKNVGSEMYDAWKDWKDLAFDGMPERDSRGVRVCDYKMQAVVEWVKGFLADDLRSGKGGIVWYHHQEVGKWLAETLVESGAIDSGRLVHAVAGEHSNRVILDPANKGKVIVASISAHGTGKNLQHFENMYIVQWPRAAKEAEQLIGRLHRRGQLADELIVHTNHTLLFDQLNMAACLNDALYIHQTTGLKQKLIYANYDPLPKIFPPAVLYQRGLEATKLDAEQQRLMVEKFGGYASGTT